MGYKIAVVLLSLVCILLIYRISQLGQMATHDEESLILANGQISALKLLQRAPCRSVEEAMARYANTGDLVIERKGDRMIANGVLFECVADETETEKQNVLLAVEQDVFRVRE